MVYLRYVGPSGSIQKKNPVFRPKPGILSIFFFTIISNRITNPWCTTLFSATLTIYDNKKHIQPRVGRKRLKLTPISA